MTTPQEDLVKTLPKLDAVTETVPVGMPFFRYLYQAPAAYEQLMAYRDQLEPQKLDYSKVEDVPTIIGACREALSASSVIVFPDSESKKEWDKAKAEADLVMWDMLETAKYRLKKVPELYSVVTAIREGGSYASFIQDLNDLSVLFRENWPLFEEINYDYEYVTKSAKLSNKLSELRARATVDKSESPELRVTRDKCFTLLKETLEPALERAAWLMRSDKKTAEKFEIKPPKKKSKKKKESEMETVA